MNETVKTIALYAGACALGLTIGAAYDCAKKAFNKRFPDYEPIVEHNPNVSAIGLALTCASGGYLIGSNVPLGLNLPTLGYVTGLALVFHDNIINMWAMAGEVFRRTPKTPKELFSPELQAQMDENRKRSAELRQRTDDWVKEQRAKQSKKSRKAIPS